MSPRQRQDRTDIDRRVLEDWAGRRRHWWQGWFDWEDVPWLIVGLAWLLLFAALLFGGHR